MTNVPEVTDADVRLWSECVKRGENEAQAIARARAEEREACAKVCDERARAVDAHRFKVIGDPLMRANAEDEVRACESAFSTSFTLAAAIRARSEGGKA